MCELHAPIRRRRGQSTAPFLVASQGLRICRLRIVVRREWIDRVDRLRDFPADIGRHTRLLVKAASFPNEPWTERRVAGVGQIDLSGVTARDQRWPLIDRAVTINARDRGCVARLAVEHAVAM